MRRSFKFFWLLFVLGTTTVAFNACSQSSTYDKGVVINGVKWATRNVDEPGTFATQPEDAGMFYQWNRKTAWSATGTVYSWDKSDPPFSYTWEEKNDPSPAGWRLPSLGEFEKLFKPDKVSHEWTTQNGINGIKFTDKATGNSLFLPAVGCRRIDGSVCCISSQGMYWNGSAHRSGFAYSLIFSNNYADWMGYDNCCMGYSVRPVAK